MGQQTSRAAALGVVGLFLVVGACPARSEDGSLYSRVFDGQSRSAPQTPQGAIKTWPERSRDMARVVLEEFGHPDIVERGRLVWLDRSPWQKIVVFREARAFSRPGILQMSVDYDAADERQGELAAVGRGASFDAAQRVLVACSDSFETNLLALNLAEEVMRGRRTAGQARRFYDRTLALSFSGKSSRYMSRLLFRSRSPRFLARPQTRSTPEDLTGI